MTTYIFVEVNTTKKTKIKASNPCKAIKTFLRRFPKTESHRVVGSYPSKEVFIHYNDAK